MATLGYDEQALEDIARLAMFVAQVDPGAAAGLMNLIEDALGTLEAHPRIGRPVRGDLRELIISHGATGYVALYAYFAHSEHVQVYGVRHQREAGFDEEF